MTHRVPLLRRTMIINGHETKYGIRRVFHNNNIVLLIENVPDNCGMSVTNAIERIAAFEMKEFGKTITADIRTAVNVHILIFEYYPVMGDDPETYDVVNMDASVAYNGDIEFSNPSWRHVSKGFVMTMLGIL